MKRLTPLLLAVFFVVTWKELVANQYVTVATLGRTCQIDTIDQSEKFIDKLAAMARIAALETDRKLEHKVFDIKLKQVEETELPR